MSTFSRIPATVQRMLASDAACEKVLLCAFSDYPIGIPTPSVVDHVATTPDAQQAEGQDWKLLYDVMKVEHQKVTFEAHHFERVAQSYRSLTGKELSGESFGYMKECIHQYIADSTTAESPAQNVKLMSWLPSDPTTAQPNSFSFVLFFVKSFFPPAEWYETGTNMALLYNARRENPNAKVVQSGIRGRATDLQKTADVFEALLVHDAQDGYLVTEGSRSNYLLLDKDNHLLCSAEEDILIGITLRAARRAALRAGLGGVHHQKLTLKDVCEAKSFIMLGTSPGTLPVREIMLYGNQTDKETFEAAVKHVQLDLAALVSEGRVVTTAEEPPSAWLRFEVHNDVVDKLMKAYHDEALS